MTATVAICTWNRAALLDRTLARLAESRLPAGTMWDVVVVDNNCTDATGEVLARHADRLPLRALAEPVQGHSHARNRAVSAARGELLVWTDDDVLVGVDWLADLIRAADEHPWADYFGGPVRPWFESVPPAWARDSLAELGYCWALVDHGVGTRELAPGEYAYGANFAVRLDAIKARRFDPDYGRVAGKLNSGDETRLQDELRASGRRGLWVGPAAVEHYLPASRLTAAYVREVVYWAGYHGYGPFAADAAPRLRGAPRWLWARRLKLGVRRRLLGVRGGRAWTLALADEAKAAGLLARFRRESRS